MPMTPQVVAVLEALSNEPVVSQQGYVFVDKKGQPVDDHMDRVWARALRNSSIRHRKSYNLRHSFVTECIFQGLALPYIAKIIGHSTVDTLVRLYPGWLSDATAINNENRTLEEPPLLE